ncbi:MAG: hypothetical protein IFK94_00010 [Acidobacteria bacterium]|uniref:Uncharacterized protein n=1 Tax=Candidatus Polarisedimenticola svalbardensis TaxID=2886004 RepID=A0A8J6XTG0_9BACT|nr:hypothetical protein [Candidatus Polarisedimenticola svalbardensis]
MPDIQKLIEKADSEKERIQLLKQQREQLEEVIRYESRRQVLLARREQFQEDGVQLLTDLESVDAELSAIDDSVAGSPFRDEIAQLQDRLEARREGSVVLQFGSRHLTLDRDLVLGLPFGRIILFNLRTIQSLLGKRQQTVENLESD